MQSETEYIWNAKWYEKDVPKCPECGSPMQTIFTSRTHRDKPKEYWVCPFCGFEEVKFKKEVEQKWK